MGSGRGLLFIIIDIDSIIYIYYSNNQRVMESGLGLRMWCMW
jgi:hypothetical protein